MIDIDYKNHFRTLILIKSRILQNARVITKIVLIRKLNVLDDV